MDPKQNEVQAHTEPAAEMLGAVVDQGALDALNAALEPAKPDPQPGDALPPPDSAPRAPEGDGATDPADNAPQPAEPKADEKKTVEPTAPKADDPAVEPRPDGGMQKRPSDEFGELPKDVKAETRERFDAMRSKYDEVVASRATAEAERDTYRDLATRWEETVASTKATPEQFGAALECLAAVNEGTPEGLQRAYDLMQGELAVLAKALGKPVDGLHDPLADYPDLQELAEDDPRLKPIALETAAARSREKLGAASREVRTTQTAEQRAIDAGLAAVKAFGDSMRSDPNYAATTAAIRPMVERVVANLPPDQWEAAVRELYTSMRVVAAPAAPAAPAVVTALRPTSTPTAGGLDKQPGNALEAMEMALQQL